MSLKLSPAPATVIFFWNLRNQDLAFFLKRTLFWNWFFKIKYFATCLQNAHRNSHLMLDLAVGDIFAALSQRVSPQSSYLDKWTKTNGVYLKLVDRPE